MRASVLLSLPERKWETFWLPLSIISKLKTTGIFYSVGHFLKENISLDNRPTLLLKPIKLSKTSPSILSHILFLKFYLFIYFLLYNIVLVLPYFSLNPPWVYMCSQSWTPLPPLSPYFLIFYNWSISERKRLKTRRFYKSSWL